MPVCSNVKSIHGEASLASCSVSWRQNLKDVVFLTFSIRKHVEAEKKRRKMTPNPDSCFLFPVSCRVSCPALTFKASAANNVQDALTGQHSRHHAMIS